ncbi:uncharacterized protein LOC106181382 [Lingula anatina]|uniref:Uncharacterized protein LOC106181382 n=1 Tax=Lingula anatina TaxID=7574 RepID=A0A1S3KG50_LINAN|nr:uncharacterized protein LOC106181382 [Lingula anatina]|eukprot:XP_013421206.1 uncharacterized protein LOC106181382 [Lingula anatina]
MGPLQRFISFAKVMSVFPSTLHFAVGLTSMLCSALSSWSFIKQVGIVEEMRNLFFSLFRLQLFAIYVVIAIFIFKWATELDRIFGAKTNVFILQRKSFKKFCNRDSCYIMAKLVGVSARNTWPYLKFAAHLESIIALMAWCICSYRYFPISMSLDDLPVMLAENFSVHISVGICFLDSFDYYQNFFSTILIKGKSILVLTRNFQRVTLSRIPFKLFCFLQEFYFYRPFFDPIFIKRKIRHLVRFHRKKKASRKGKKRRGAVNRNDGKAMLVNKVKPDVAKLPRQPPKKVPGKTTGIGPNSQIERSKFDKNKNSSGETNMSTVLTNSSAPVLKYPIMESCVPEIQEDENSEASPHVETPPYVYPRLGLQVTGNRRTRTCSETSTASSTESAYSITSEGQYRGITLIINNCRYFPATKMHNRYGTMKDEKHIEDVFSKLKYKVIKFRDYTCSDLKHRLRQLGSKMEAHYDSFVCFVLSHGEDGYFYTVDGERIFLADLISYFYSKNCPQLENKPRLFVSQMCLGGAELNDGGSADNTGKEAVSKRTKCRSAIMKDAEGEKDCKKSLSTVPAAQEADFLLAFATLPGCAAKRYAATGSPFIKTFLGCVKKYYNRKGRTRKCVTDILKLTGKRLKKKENQVHCSFLSINKAFYLTIPAMN